MSKRHTVTVNEETYRKLQRCGTFNESYSQLISRLVDLAEYARRLESAEFKGDINDK
jgi:predicted CopG family antitoxin